MYCLFNICHFVAPPTEWPTGAYAQSQTHINLFKPLNDLDELWSNPQRAGFHIGNVKVCKSPSMNSAKVLCLRGAVFVAEHFSFDLNIGIVSISSIFIKMSYRYRIGLEKFILTQL